MKDKYEINDLLKEENSKYSWYQDIYDGKRPRYKMDKPRPYDDADYYYAQSFDKITWYLYFKGSKIGVETRGIENTNNALVSFNSDIQSKMVHN